MLLDLDDGALLVADAAVDTALGQHHRDTQYLHRWYIKIIIRERQRDEKTKKNRKRQKKNKKPGRKRNIERQSKTKRGREKQRRTERYNRQTERRDIE